MQKSYFGPEGSRKPLHCDGDSPMVTDGDFLKMTKRSATDNLAISDHFSSAIPMDVTILTPGVRLWWN